MTFHRSVRGQAAFFISVRQNKERKHAWVIFIKLKMQNACSLRLTPIVNITVVQPSHSNLTLDLSKP